MSPTTQQLEAHRSLIQKADITLADLAPSNGLLVPAQASKFIIVLTKISVLMGLVTVRPMKAQQEYINKTRFIERVLRAGEEGIPLAQGDRARPEWSKVELVAKLFKGEIELTNEVLEDNIEQGTLKDTVMGMATEAVARDLEEVMIKGDTASADPFLARFDGLLKQASSHVYDHAGGRLNRAAFKAMFQLLPVEFRRDKRALSFFTSSNAEIDWRDSLADRGTPMGDERVTTQAMVPWTGIPVMDIPMFPDDLGVGSDETDVLLMDPKNATMGIWRQIRIETDKNISAGLVKFVVTLRADCKFTHEPAVVKAIGVLNA